METNYRRLLLTLVVSLCIMYAVMFLNVSDTSHIYLNLTRLYMSLLMVTPMALLMLLMMPKMYTDKKMNVAVVVSSVAVFLLSFVLLRTQTPIGDEQYMKSMIPHHSSAIMASQHANIKDPEVRKLANGIIASQEREINQMRQILHRMEQSE